MSDNIISSNREAPTGARDPALNAGSSASCGDDLAIVLDGGGARAAYQVGLLRALARHYPALRIPIITGVSAGAINAAFLASHPGTLHEAADELTGLWHKLNFEHVFRVDWRSLLGNLGHWGSRLAGGGVLSPPARGLVNNAPLRATLARCLGATSSGEIPGIARNIEAGRLEALAIITSSYTTGRSVAWVQGCRKIEGWDGPLRHSIERSITLDHVMASAALPVLFPAAELDGSWHGDGGIRLNGPLSPALHLGANRILAISTRLGSDPDREEPTAVSRHPSPLQIAGHLLNAVFVDDHDRDTFTLKRINSLVQELPRERRHGLRPVDFVLIRPSVNLGAMAREFEPHLPRLFRYLMRGLGSRDPSGSDLLSLLMFDSTYLARLIAIGEADAERRIADVAGLLAAPRSNG